MTALPSSTNSPNHSPQFKPEHQQPPQTFVYPHQQQYYPPPPAMYPNPAYYNPAYYPSYPPPATSNITQSYSHPPHPPHHQYVMPAQYATYPQHPTMDFKRPESASSLHSSKSSPVVQHHPQPATIVSKSASQSSGEKYVVNKLETSGSGSSGDQSNQHQYLGLYSELRRNSDNGRSETTDEQASLIRVWKDSATGQNFYDCVCGRRKPLRNLKAIIQHTTKHAEKVKKTYSCPKCDRTFNHYLGLNSHQRTHKEILNIPSSGYTAIPPTIQDPTLRNVSQ